MKPTPRFLLIGGLFTVLGAWLYLGCRPEPPSAPVRETPNTGSVPPSPGPEARGPSGAETRWHDGAAWRTGVWASDEMQVVLAPGADPARALPEAGVFTRSGDEAGVKIPPAADRAAFAVRVKEMEKRPGVKQARPVFYATEAAREKRSLPARMILTRQVAATLPEGASPETVAARYGARVLTKLEFMERTWLFETAGPFDALDVASALRERDGIAFAAPQFARVQSRKARARRLIPNDPLFTQQWHLQNTSQSGGTPGEDINVVNVWDSVQGDGIVIGIVDDGLDGAHEDLAPNYSAALSIDIIGGDPDPTPTDTLDSHGTACAGLAAARGNNGIGVSGAAPRATLAGIRLITDVGTTDVQEAQAMSHQNGSIHIKSNSWGPPDGLTDLYPVGGLTQAAILDGVANGRGGRGVVYLWAGGNGLSFSDNSNRDAYASLRQAVAVSAVDDQGIQTSYSEPGANLLVCAPGGFFDIVTTDLTGALGDNAGNYRTNFAGTSTSCPIAAGVVALMLHRNPNLKARDVTHVLARTARQNHPGDLDWTTNAAGFTVNHKYGHGAVDAAAAVGLAGRWPYVGTEVARSASSGGLSLAIPEFPGPAVSNSLVIAGPPLRAEHVEIDFSASHEYRGDIEVTLVAPSGTRSVMMSRRGSDDDAAVGFQAWRMMSVRHWGELAAGTWTLEVKDAFAADVGTFTGWTLRVYGTAVDSTQPVAGVVRDGPGADLDHLSSLTTVDANWSGFSEPDSGLVFEWAIGTSAGGEQVLPFTPVGYATSASASGLSLAGGTPYFVTVRATNFDNLATTVSSDGFLVDNQPPNAPAAPGVSPGGSVTGLFTLTWGTPFDPGDSGVASYSVERSKDGGAFAAVAGGITLLTLLADVSADGPGSYTFRVGAVDLAGNAGAFSAASAAVLYDPTPPVIAISPPGAVGTPLALGGTVSDNIGVSVVTWVNAATGLGGLASGTGPWSASVALAPGLNSITVFGWDSLGNVGTSTILVAFTPSDVLPPSLTISAPTSADTFSTGTTPIALSGGLFDDTGVTALAWENLTTGTRGTIAVAPFWTTSVPLLAGSNVIVVTARDAAGNATTDTLTIGFTPAADATLPAIAITGPTAAPTFGTATSPLSLSGTASDNAALALVRWSNAATGGGATASGLGTWTASVVALAPGSNVITATAVDASGNEASDVLTVTFTPGGGDTVPPTVAILSPPPASTTSVGAALLTGLASDNVAALEVVWSNVTTGDSGTATGVAAWSAVVPLASGANVITVTAFDARGNSRSATLTLTFAPPGSGGGGGGGGGCGATGLELLLLAPFLRRRRR